MSVQFVALHEGTFEAMERGSQMMAPVICARAVRGLMIRPAL